MTADIHTHTSAEARRVAKWTFNAVPLTTPALSRVFSFLYYQIRPHFSVGARTASFSAAAVSLCHPNLLSPFTIINSVLPTKHLFDHIDHDELFELPIPQGRWVA